MLRRTIRRFFGDDTGSTVIEYATIAALVAVTFISIVIGLGGSISNKFETVDSSVAPAVASVGGTGGGDTAGGGDTGGGGNGDTGGGTGTGVCCGGIWGGAWVGDGDGGEGG